MTGTPQDSWAGAVQSDADPAHEGTAAHRATPVAVVGTLAEFGRDPVSYDLAGLVRFVRAIAPDLLCLDMTLDQWLRRDFGNLPAEYRDALLPLADQTDIVVVPIGEPGGALERTGIHGDTAGHASGVRGLALRRLRSAVASLERGAGRPVAVNEGVRHWAAEILYHFIDRIQDPRARETGIRHREALAARIVEVARRDSGRRILVVVNARHCHHLRRALGRHGEVTLVPYSEL